MHNDRCPRTLSGLHSWNRERPRSCIACNVIDDSPEVIVYRERQGETVIEINENGEHRTRPYVDGERLTHTTRHPLTGEVNGPRW